MKSPFLALSQTLFLLMSVTFFAMSAEASSDRSIRVSGLCRKEISPDRSAIRISAEFLDKEAQVASQKATATFERIREKVRSHSIANLELETTDFSVIEEHEWIKDRNVSKGYKARVSLRVSSSDFAFSSKVIGIALEEGVKNIGSLETYTSPALIDQTRFECLQEAVLNAQAKAQKMAEALKARVGKVLSIEEHDGNVSPAPQPRFHMAKAALEMASASMDGPAIETGKTSISTQVTVNFAIR